MAYVIGLLTQEEIDELEERGWELEDAPKELIDPDAGYDPGRMKMVWVDTSMFDVMDGPDWEGSSKVGTVTKDLRQKLAELPKLPWTVWTSNSFRRITSAEGRDGDVLHGTTQRSDGHPDLSMNERLLKLLVDVVNAVPKLLDELDSLRKRVRHPQD